MRAGRAGQVRNSFRIIIRIGFRIRGLRAVGILGVPQLTVTLFVIAGSILALAVHSPSDGESAETSVNDVIVELDQADLTGVPRAATKVERAGHVVSRLQATAKAHQAELLAELDRRGVPAQPYWIVNAIRILADDATMTWLRRRGQVREIHDNRPVRLTTPAPRRAVSKARPRKVEWNVAAVRAPEVWSLGISGEGVVVASHDTGVDGTHPALAASYRGAGGIGEADARSWHDAAGECPGSSPCDVDGHGTHTTGTMVGDAGIGVAPGAQWIACRASRNGTGTPASYLECFQWLAAPTEPGGHDPDPTRAPHVVTTSWGCLRAEGCTQPAILADAVRHVRAAGIVVVGAAGNSGPVCSSIDTEPAILDETVTVGATEASGQLALSSSRGPVTFDGSKRIKPDVVAPGIDVVSASPGGGLSVLSGTSMAAPAVAGVVALVISARPDLAGRVEDIETVITQTAIPIPDSGPLGGCTSPDGVPNNAAGFGRIDALAAVEAALATPPTPPPDDDSSTGDDPDTGASTDTSTGTNGTGAGFDPPAPSTPEGQDGCGCVSAAHRESSDGLALLLLCGLLARVRHSRCRRATRTTKNG